MTSDVPSLPPVAAVYDRRGIARVATPAVAATAVIDGRCKKPFFAALVDFPARALVLLIRLYQRTLSPALPVLTMGRCACRFSPTCSHYAAEAIRTHGVLAGVALAVMRLIKCTPLHPGGFDPVPGKDDRTTRLGGYRTSSENKPTCRPISASHSPVVR